MNKKIAEIKKNGFNFANILLISFAHLLHDIYGSFLPPVMPLLIEKLNISYFQSGLLSVFQRIPSVFNPFIGLLADRVNLRYFIIISPSATAISMCLLGIAPDFASLSAILLTMGISSAIFHVPSPIMIKKVSGNRIGMGMSFYMLGGEIARTLGPITILGAVSLWGFENTWRLIPVALVASFILFVRLKKIKIYKNFQQQEKSNSSFETFKHYLPFFSAIGLFIFFTSLTKSALTFYLPLFLNLKGESLWYGGIALAIFQFAGAGGTFLSGTISDTIGREKTLLASSIATPLIMIAFVKFSTGWLSFVFLVLLGISIFASMPVLLATVNTINSDRPAFINGIFMTLNFVFGTFPVLIIGGLSDIIGMEITYYIAAFTALLAIPFVVMIFKQKEKIEQ